MNFTEIAKARQSCRAYDNTKEIEQEKLDAILEAGRLAPSACNGQPYRFTVCRGETAKQVAACVTGMGMNKFAADAPVLIVTANRRDYGNAIADSACALENMMIAANALDLGSCWINQLHWLDKDEAVREYLYGLGLGENDTVTGALALGYAADGLPNRTALPRTGNPVTWVNA